MEYRLPYSQGYIPVNSQQGGTPIYDYAQPQQHQHEAFTTDLELNEEADHANGAYDQHNAFDGGIQQEQQEQHEAFAASLKPNQEDDHANGAYHKSNAYSDSIQQQRLEPLHAGSGCHEENGRINDPYQRSVYNDSISQQPVLVVLVGAPAGFPAGPQTYAFHHGHGLYYFSDNPSGFPNTAGLIPNNEFIQQMQQFVGGHNQIQYPAPVARMGSDVSPNPYLGYPTPPYEPTRKHRAKRARGGSSFGIAFEIPERGPATTEGFFGIISSQAPEIIHKIINRMSLKSFLAFKQINKHFWSICDKIEMKKIKAVKEHLPYLWHALSTQAGIQEHYTWTVVDLAFKAHCVRPQCFEAPVYIYLPTMVRVCHQCLFKDGYFRTIVKSSATAMYAVSEREVTQLPMVKYDSNSKMIKRMYLFSDYLVHQFAVKRYGSEMALLAAVKDQDDRKLAAYEKNKQTEIAIRAFKQEPNNQDLLTGPNQEPNNQDLLAGNANPRSKNVSRIRPPRTSTSVTMQQDLEFRRGVSIFCAILDRETLAPIN